MDKKYNLFYLCCRILACALFISVPDLVSAQNKITISGTIVNENNEPIIGANVVVRDTNVGVYSNIDGVYSIDASYGDILEFSYIGCQVTFEQVAAQSIINVTLVEDRTTIEDIVVVGYGVQKRGSITGSVAAVGGEDMLQTKSENTQNMLTGRISGVRVWQKSSEPGSYNNSMDIRGMGSPLVIIDGVPRTTSDFQRMNPSDIEDVTVLKDAAAAIYGLRAANGVVLVTTKKGKSGETQVNYNGSYTLQTPSSMPQLLNAEQTMTLYNEMSMNSLTGGYLVYDDSWFEDYSNGSRTTTNWNDLIFSKVAPQTQHDISISGGNDKTQYFASMGYLYQEGFFSTGDLNYSKFNLRSNITTQIASGLSVELNIAGFADEQNNPYTSSSDIIRNYWKQGVLFPAYADAEGTMLNYEGLDLEQNTLAMIDSDVSGYRQYLQKQFQSSAALNYDFGTLSPALQGLTAKAMVSYDYSFNDDEEYRKEYYQYAYDADTDSYIQKLYSDSSPSKLTRTFYSSQQFLSQFILNYNRTFKEKHSIGALVGWEAQSYAADNFSASRELSFASPYLFNGVVDGQTGSSDASGVYQTANMAALGRLNYAYDDRYLLEAQFRYDGSSKFAPGYQWGFFPSVSAGWRVSEEKFFKQNSSLSFIDQFKLRASYGVMGDDSGANYAWVEGYTYPTSSGNESSGNYNQYSPGYVFDGEFIYGATATALANTAITWYTAHTMNVGFDFTAWGGLFGMTVDYYERTLSGLFAQSSTELSTVVGADAPVENANSSKNLGLEVELSHRNVIGDLSYNVKLMGSVTREKYLVAVQNDGYGNSYDQWRNDNLNDRYQGLIWGYESAGRYTDWEDIWSYDIRKSSDILPGDYKYVDWNGDGEINSLDEHPIAFDDNTPALNFSFSLDCVYKSFDLSLLFQGTAFSSMQYQEPLYSIWGSNGGGALEQYWDRWHPTDATADPYNPSTEWESGYYAYTGHSPYENSEFNIVSTDYLRLKSIEVGYTLPRFGNNSTTHIRVYANAYNLLTFTNVKFVDPEHPEDDMGRLYPLNKSYTLGLSLSF